MRFTVIDEVRQVYSTFTFVLQKLRFDDDAIEFRLGLLRCRQIAKRER